MAVTITVSDVTDVQPTTLPDSYVEGLIAYVDQADACLDANNVPDEVQSNLKILGAAAMLYTSSKGNVESERSPTGASRTYKTSDGKDYLGDNPWGQQLKMMDQYGCVTSLLQGPQRTYLKSVGPGGRTGGAIYPRSGIRGYSR